MAVAAAYRTSAISRRRRRTKAEIDAIRRAIYAIVAADHPCTVRQVFYRLVSEGLIAKTENEYKATVCRLLKEMRLDDEIPFGWIADSTRWQRKPDSYSSLASAINITASAYRRAVWDNQPVYVEVWCEKEALAGVLHEVTSKWDVPLMVSRGFSSLSFVYEAAQDLRIEDRPCHIYYFGDLDPSGVAIEANLEERLLEFSGYADIRFQRVAVTPEQVRDWNLPLRPTKRTDSRAKNWSGGSVEVDAIPPKRLRQIVAESIVQHVDRREYDKLQAAEQAERELLRRMVELAEGGSAA